MITKIYEKYGNLATEQLHRKKIHVDFDLQAGIDNILYVYFECLCLQRKGIDKNVLFDSFACLIKSFLDELKKFKEDTNCFEFLKVLINYSARMECEYRSKKMSDKQDEMFEDYLRNLANDYYFVMPPETIDREADKYREEPKYQEQELNKRKRWLSWLWKRK